MTKKLLFPLTAIYLLLATNHPTHAQDLLELNPIQQNVSVGRQAISQTLARLLPILIVLAGLLLLVMLILGGFTMLTNPTKPEAQEAGKNRILFAIVGFVLLFVSFWIIQILEIIFNINIV